MLDSSLVAQLPTTAIAAGGNPLFSEVFLAGASIALASVVATVFVGILVRGNYDDLEASFFEAQEDSLEESREKDSRAENTDAARDFFVTRTCARPHRHPRPLCRANRVRSSSAGRRVRVCPLARCRGGATRCLA